MSVELICKKCQATCTGHVLEDDPETNSFIAEPHGDWEGGDKSCPHDDYEYGEEDFCDPFIDGSIRE